MGDHESRDGHSQSLTRSFITNLQSYFGMSSKPESADTSESPGKSKGPDAEDHNPVIDISSALRSVALMGKLDFGQTSPRMFTPPLDEEDDSKTSVDPSGTESMDSVEDEEPAMKFQSMFVHRCPLYQDYCLQSVRDDLHRLHSKGFTSDLITSQYLKNLQTRLSPLCFSEPPTLKCTSTPSFSPPQPIKVTPCTLWQDLEEVKTAGLLRTLTHKEVRLQEATFELISSEASYLKSLGVTVNHFYASKTMKKSLTSMEHHILFYNIGHVKEASEKFLMDLEVRLGENVVICEVGDLVLKHCADFHRLYVPYVTNMMYQEALINRLLHQNRDFVVSLKKLEGHRVCQRQSLKSFLVLPFQRVTRIKLILETILRLTAPDNASVSSLEKAKRAIHEILSNCDKEVRKMKQMEELVCLEMQLDFGKLKAFPLVVSGRLLVHQGSVKRLTVGSIYNSRTSFVNVHLHLFNDLLIISSKKDERFLVDDHAEFPKHVHMEQLKTEVLGLPSESFLLRLSHSQTGQPTAMILTTRTRSEKKSWIKVLSCET